MNLFERRKKESKSFKLLSQKVEEKRQVALGEIKNKHKGVLSWAKQKGIKVEDLVAKGTRGIATGAATGAIILTSGLRPVAEPPSQKIAASKELEEELYMASLEAKKDIRGQVKKDLGGIGYQDSENVAKNLTKSLNIPLKTKLEGIRLNTSYGIIGYESHLTRYPGDNLTTHFETDTDYGRYAHASMAGGPGAWGYIANSKDSLTKKDIERERYYLVAQTFLSPNWGGPKIKQWFRHRKFAVVNPQNGRVVIGTLEDAGPDPITGRNFGGSPEVMEALGFGGGGSYVYMFFVDDPKDEIPLGVYGL